MDWRVALSDLNYGPEEEQAVVDVLRRRWLTMGAVTGELEERFAGLVGVEHAVALSNATVALHLACLALGIGPGDEVIVPSLTFVASCNAVLYTGADVRFAEVVGPGELNLSPESVAAAVNERTRAIMVVHYGGFPCRMPALRDLAERHGLAIIEDAAHAPGASLDGASLGAWGDVGCFSFFSNKNMATGEGGILVTDREDLAQTARLLRSHGMTSLTWDRHRGHAYTYDVVALGYNYRIDEIRSALGLVQLGRLAGGNRRRQEITNRYREAFAAMGLEVPFLQDTGSPSYHLFPILLPQGQDRQAFMDRMRAQRIQTSIHYPPVHGFEYYRRRYPGVVLPVTEAVARRVVTLPLYPTMSNQQVDWVVGAVEGALEASPA